MDSQENGIDQSPFVEEKNNQIPHPLIAAIPLLMLIGLLTTILILFGSDALSGGSQIALLLASAISICVSMFFYRTPWKQFEEQIKQSLGNVSVTLIILLVVGMLAGSWMISGVVPTLIYYGVQIMSPRFFLVSTCVICALVSIMSGSSWTTIATIGIALLGIGEALDVPEAWTAGSIISGAYFGDKMSPLSDTTILASSASKVDIFSHIRYMTYTTIPSISIALIIFLIAGFFYGSSDALQVSEFTNGLSATFNISIFTLIVPIITGIMIAKRMPSLVVLFVSSMLAGICAIIFQPDILKEIAASNDIAGALQVVKGLAITFFGATNVETGSDSLNELVSTGGMAGMLNTIWLIMCSMCFGGSMVASHMLESLTNVVLRLVKNRVSLVSSTVGTGIFLNLATGDQSISIILTADMYREVYEKEGYEGRLLSRTTEDAGTVTSVLIPWNTCGMTQSTVLGVPTLTYLPYCFFNLISPFMSIIVAATGWKIRRVRVKSEK